MEIVLLVMFVGVGGFIGFCLKDSGEIGELENQLWKAEWDFEKAKENDPLEIRDTTIALTKQIETLKPQIEHEKKRYFHRILSSLPPVLKGGLAGYLFIWIPWTILAWIVKGFSGSK